MHFWVHSCHECCSLVFNALFNKAINLLCYKVTCWLSLNQPITLLSTESVAVNAVKQTSGIMLVYQVVRPPEQQHYPMFDVNPGRHSDTDLDFDSVASEKIVHMSVVNKKRHSSADEFTLL